MAGNEYDYTNGPINKAVVLLSIPMVLEMAMESLFAIVDIFFVAKLGANAISAVGLTEAVITLIYAIAFGFGLAVTAVISRRVGEKNTDAAAVTAVQVLLLTLVVSILLGLVGLLYSEDLLGFMGAEQEVVDVGVDYTRIMLVFSVTIMTLFIVSSVFRGAGNPIIAMRALWLANGLNIVLDPCFIFGYGPFPELGVTGAAVATNIGRGAGSVYLLYHLVAGNERIKIQWLHICVSWKIISNLVQVSIGGIGQMIIATASWVLLMRLVSEFGSIAVAGYTIAIRIVIFAMLPAWGISNAAATLVGQNLGAKSAGRAEQSVWVALAYTAAYMFLVAIVMMVCREALIGFFNQNTNIISVGSQVLLIFSIAFTFFGMGMVLTQALNGAGDTATPTWINFICFWLFQIPFAYFTSITLNWGPAGVFIAVALSDTFIFLLALWQFRLGKWKTMQV